MTTAPNSTRTFRSQYMALLSRRRLRWLGALTCTSSALAMLAGCDSSTPQQQVRIDPTEQTIVYKSLDECKAAQADNRVCDLAMDEAKEWQDQQPGYSLKQQCEEEYGYGNCERRSSGGNNWFVPAMAGFMLSNAMNNMSYDNYRRAQRDRDYAGYSYPVYVNNRGYVSTYSGRGNQPLGYKVSGSGRKADLPRNFNVQSDPSGAGYTAPGTYSRKTSYKSSSRGGFGKSASARGGCCG